MQKDNELKKTLSASDADLVRVLEDLIDVLITNGTIRLTDLPPQALEKINARKRTRQRMRGALDLINDDEDVI